MVEKGEGGVNGGGWFVSGDISRGMVEVSLLEGKGG